METTCRHSRLLPQSSLRTIDWLRIHLCFIPDLLRKRQKVHYPPTNAPDCNKTIGTGKASSKTSIIISWQVYRASHRMEGNQAPPTVGHTLLQNRHLLPTFLIRKPSYVQEANMVYPFPVSGNWRILILTSQKLLHIKDEMPTHLDYHSSFNKHLLTLNSTLEELK